MVVARQAAPAVAARVAVAAEARPVRAAPADAGLPVTRVLSPAVAAVAVDAAMVAAVEAVPVAAADMDSVVDEVAADVVVAHVD